MEGGDVEKTERAPSMDPEAIGPLLLDIRAAPGASHPSGGGTRYERQGISPGSLQKAIDMVSSTMQPVKQKWILIDTASKSRMTCPDLVIYAGLDCPRRLGSI